MKDYKGFHQDIMTLSELAQYLKLAEKTVLRMVHKGEIPCIKIASQWRFIKSVIDRWLMSGMSAQVNDEREAFFRSSATLVPLSRLTSEERIITDLEPGTKKHILEQLVSPLVHDNSVADKERFLQRLLTREQMVSTAVDGGIALPHLRHPDQSVASETALVIGVCRKGADFGSPDGEKSYVFFLICTNDEVIHLKVLATLGRLIKTKDITTQFRSAPTREDVLREIISFEQQILSETPPGQRTNTNTAVAPARFN